MLPLADLFVHVDVVIDDAIATKPSPSHPAKTRPACTDAEVLAIALVRHLLAGPARPSAKCLTAM